MAKIIDIKTGRVLADLPFKKTLRSTLLWKVMNEDFSGKIFFIAKVEREASLILENVKAKLTMDHESYVKWLDQKISKA